MQNKTQTKVTYEIALSDQEWTPNGYYPKGHTSIGFSFYSYSPWSNIKRLTRNAVNSETLTREEVIALADAEYGVEVNTQNGSYRLRETTHTTATVEDKTDKETFVSKFESTHVVIFHESFRTEAQTEKFYLQPKREWEAAMEKARQEEKAAATPAISSDPYYLATHLVENKPSFSAWLSKLLLRNR